MTKADFKERWESNDNGGGLTYNDLADCAIKWGVFTNPKAMCPSTIRYEVLKAADTNDCEEFNPLTTARTNYKQGERT